MDLGNIRLSQTDIIADLISKIALRDRKAFDTLYSHTSSKLFGVLCRLLTDRAEAEDALQEVYVRIWQKADRFATQDASAMSWVYAIARNHAIDRLRTRKTDTSPIDDMADFLADDAKSPEQNAVASGEAAAVEHCMEKLGELKADAVRAAYMEGYSYQELSDRYKIPLNTMRTWLRRSLQSLRACLEER
jgi:RNA polymerase sigma-70 factor (ECF subfamily)